MIVKTEAVVLKAIRYRETSKIVTFYTEKFGKLKGMVKGAVAPKSKFGAALEPMSYVSLVLYKKENRDLHLVSQCDLVKLLPRLHSNLEKIAAGLTVVELINAAMHNEETNEPAFLLLLGILSELDRATKNVENVLYYFRLHLLDLMGFRPNFQTCVRCRKRLLKTLSDQATVSFDAFRGGLLCSPCSQGFSRRLRLSIQTIKTIQEFFRIPLTKVTTVEVSEVSKKEMDEVLRTYARYHLTGLEKLRTEAVLKKLAI